MVKRVFLDGQLHAFLIAENEDDEDFSNPVLDTLQAQADRIEFLEQQNEALLNQERILRSLLDMASDTRHALQHEMSELKKILNNGDEVYSVDEDAITQDS